MASKLFEEDTSFVIIIIIITIIIIIIIIVIIIIISIIEPERHGQEEPQPQKIFQIQRPDEAQCSCPVNRFV